MRIILDTNVLQSNLGCLDIAFDILLDYTDRTRSKIVLPRLVIDELTANYGRSLLSTMDKYRSSVTVLSKMTESAIPCLPIDIDIEKLKFRARILAKFSIKESELIPTKSDYLDEAVRRGIERLAPCHRDGQQMRDALLWRIVLEQAREGAEIAFITQNTRDFCVDGKLHSHLTKEAEAINAKVAVYISLDEFIKRHVKAVEFATKEWLANSIPGDQISEAARSKIEVLAERRLDRFVDDGEEPTGYISMTDALLEPDEFFVYEMADSSFRFESSWLGEAEFEFEVEGRIRERNLRMDFNPITGEAEMGQDPTFRINRNLCTRTKSIPICVSISGAIRNNVVSNWEIDDVSPG